VIRTLFSSLFRAFFRIVITALVAAVIAGAVALLLAYTMAGQHWPPTLLTEIAVIAIAVLAAYASGLTVLVQEAVRGVKAAERDVVRAVEH
jgi:ABC-type multidrug transport system permease subunit